MGIMDLGNGTWLLETLSPYPSPLHTKAQCGKIRKKMQHCTVCKNINVAFFEKLLNIEVLKGPVPVGRLAECTQLLLCFFSIFRALCDITVKG